MRADKEVENELKIENNTFESKKKESTPVKEQDAKAKKTEKRKKGKKNKGGFKKNEEAKEKQVIERSEFLDNLLAKLQDHEHIDYHTLRGHVHECSVDQHGSRFI